MCQTTQQISHFSVDTGSIVFTGLSQDTQLLSQLDQFVERKLRCPSSGDGGEGTDCLIQTGEDSDHEDGVMAPLTVDKAQLATYGNVFHHPSRTYSLL